MNIATVLIKTPFFEKKKSVYSDKPVKYVLYIVAYDTLYLLKDFKDHMYCHFQKKKKKSNYILNTSSLICFDMLHSFGYTGKKNYVQVV